jgi:prepilin peptidase CpaA
MDSLSWTHYGLGAFLTSPAFTLTLLIGLLIWAAGSDLKRFIIPNAAVGIIATLGLIYQLQTGGPIGETTLIAAVVLAVGFAAFALRIAGAGDAKLLAALALFAGPSEIFSLIVHTLLIGGGLSVFWLLSRPLRHGLVVAGFAIQPEPGRRLPYGIAIAGGALFMVGRLWPAF